MKCCSECFLDTYLKKLINEEGKKGDCDFCGSTNVNTIDTFELTNLFEPVVQLYSPVQHGVNVYPGEDPWEVGKPLVDLIDSNWEIFSDDLSRESKTQLLDEIVNAHAHPKEFETIDVTELWTDRKEFYESSADEKWDILARHLKRKRRYIIDRSIDEIKEIISLLPEVIYTVEESLAKNKVFYRARIGGITSEMGMRAPYDLGDMGAPSPEMVKAGRANPSGIPFLYLSDSIDTAIAEVRPWKGVLVTVAKFKLQDGIKVVDLTGMEYLDTPFGISDLAIRLYDLQLLNRLGEELSTPIDPSASDVEYVPSQYLTELIQSLNYKGMIYPSAMADGKNLVLFDEKLAKASSAKLYKVENIGYAFRELP
jgi:RES domain-containing protein